MKRIFLLALFSITSLIALAQLKFQGTLLEGSEPNTLDFAVKPVIDFNGYLSQVVFNIEVPTSVSQPVVTATSLTPYFTVLVVSAPVSETPGYLTYRISSTNAGNTAATTIASTADYPVARITFTGGEASLTDIRLSHLPGGGSTTLHQFYVEANSTILGAADFTNYVKMFYGPISSPVAAVATEEIGYTTYQYAQLSSLLPVKWVSFTAQKQNGNGLLKWEVANQVNNAYFEVQCGGDSRQFSAVGSVPSTDKNTYNFTDINLNKLKSTYAYYRIKQVDKDGKFSFSEVKKLQMNGKPFSLTVVGNPVKGSRLNLRIEAPAGNQGMLRVFDLHGKQIYQSVITWGAGYSQQAIDLPALSAGTYLASLSFENEQYQAKFVK